MTEYALIIDGAFKEIRQYAEKPIDIPHKKVVWVEVSRALGPEASSGLIDGSTWSIVTIDPATLPPRVPRSVTPRQMRLFLLSQGMLGALKQNFSTSTEAEQIEFEFASDIQRDNALVTKFAARLNLTSAQVDKMFLAASKL